MERKHFMRLGIIIVTAVIAVTMAACSQFEPRDKRFYYRALWNFALREDLAERSGKEYSVGAIYTTLQRLEDKGLLASRASAPLPVRGGRSRRQFRVTSAGSRAIQEAERQSESMWAGVGTIRRPGLA